MTEETVTQDMLDRINARCPQIDLTLVSALRTPNYFQQCWSETPFPRHIKMKLAEVDQAIIGAATIADLLTANARSYRDARDNGTVSYDPLPDYHLEGLELAQKAILSSIAGEMEYLRGYKA